jgi:hypothetical protein
MSDHTGPAGLVQAIRARIEQHADLHAGIGDVLRKLDRASPRAGKPATAQSLPPHRQEALARAIRNIPRPQLSSVAEAVEMAADRLVWRVDRGLYYAHDADVGEGYLNGNMHCILVGPDGCAFTSDEILMGLFFLSPRTLYRDHNHTAPELYMNLTGPTGWRFDVGAWGDKAPGAVIWNDPMAVHATRIYDQPWLAVFVWPDEIDASCNVVPASDWGDIEAGLQAP